jgi:hypothetical protein
MTQTDILMTDKDGIAGGVAAVARIAALARGDCWSRGAARSGGQPDPAAAQPPQDAPNHSPPRTPHSRALDPNNYKKARSPPLPPPQADPFYVLPNTSARESRIFPKKI